MFRRFQDLPWLATGSGADLEPLQRLPSQGKPRATMSSNARTGVRLVRYVYSEAEEIFGPLMHRTVWKTLLVFRQAVYGGREDADLRALDAAVVTGWGRGGPRSLLLSKRGR